jgi:galactokinase
MRDIVINAFEKHFGSSPTKLARAPGRVNLIGEHTDYNDGFVLPMAIDRNIWVAAKPRDDDKFNIHSVDFDASISFTTNQLTDSSLPHWTHLIRGVWYLLGEQGDMPPSVDISIAGDVPIGAGLSSSAAMEVVLIELALNLINKQWTQSEKALFGVEVERKFTGMPSGIMDQMAAAVSRAGHALLIDCRSLQTTPVNIPENIAVIVMDTAKRRQLVDSAYAERRQQCEESATILGVASLRDATLDMVKANQVQLGDVRFRRAHHIVTENERTLQFIDSFKHGDLAQAGKLMNKSHFSLRDDYEVSCTELDIISDIARNHSGCYGARMTGGGFGGCGVAIVDRSAVADFMTEVATAYQAQTPLQPALYEFEPAAGSEVIF